MKLVFSTADNAWVILENGVRRDIHGTRSWENRGEAVYALSWVDLTVDDEGNITSFKKALANA